MQLANDLVRGDLDGVNYEGFGCINKEDFNDEQRRAFSASIAALVEEGRAAQEAYKKTPIARFKAPNRSARPEIADPLPVNIRRRPRHRPQSEDTVLQRDEVAYFVIDTRAHNPNWSKKKLISQAMELCGVSRSYVFHAIQTLDPGRRADLEFHARVYSRWPSGEININR
jgi:hypothetical protein